MRFNPQLPHSRCLWSGKNVEILTLTQTQIDSQIFLLPWLVPARSKFSQIRGSLKVIPSWKNIIFEHEAPTRSADGRYIIAFSLTLHFSLRGNFFLSSTAPGEPALVVLPVKAASVLMEENLRVISCLCLWMSRCSSDWKRWAIKDEPTKKVPIKTETVTSAVLACKFGFLCLYTISTAFVLIL